MTAASPSVHQHAHQQKPENGVVHHLNGNCIPQPSIAENKIYTIAYTIVDVVVFLAISIGYILQDIFYLIFGYPQKELKGELALITGGGSGLGRLLALRLAKLGVNIIIWDINQTGIDETIDMVRNNGGTCLGYRVDISKKEEVYKAADVLRKDAGDVTLLINNAGVVSGRALLDTPDHLIERSFNVNVLAHFWTTKAFLPAMLEKDHGHIVTIASLAGHVGITKLVDYCSSKFAAVGFDEAIRLELENLGSQNVLTTCICPFFIQSTGMFEDVNARWVPTLTSEDVADRVVVAIQNKEKVAVLPGYLKFMLCVKWLFPWGCASGFLRRIVPDAAPSNGLFNRIPHISNISRKSESESDAEIQTTTLGENTNNNNNIIKTAAMRMKRLPSVGERVL